MRDDDQNSQSTNHFRSPAIMPSAVRIARYSPAASSDNAHSPATRVLATSGAPLEFPSTFLPEESRPLSADDYWIASSRKLPQELPHGATQPLEFFQHRPDGTLQRSTGPEMQAQLIPGIPICIFVHGAFVSAPYHQKESAHTSEWIRQAAPELPLQIIFFTWPSDADSAWANPLLINQRGRWAENNGFYLSRLIAQLPPECPICLVGHSHGARAVAATLHLLGGGTVGGYSLSESTGGARRCRAVLAGAAFDRHWMNPGERYERALVCSEGILNLRNTGDLALHVYPLRRPFSRQAIGETGWTRWDRARLGALSLRAIDLDISPIVGLGHTWLAYSSEPRIAHAIIPYVYFVDR